jgi:hypothetical protein
MCAVITITDIEHWHGRKQIDGDAMLEVGVPIF